MDPTLYKDVVTARGFNYHYLFSPPKEGQQTLVFIHGFPSTSYEWRYQASPQVPFFKEKGYGLIVPDTLGYGGSAKPTDPALYQMSLIAKDVVDILDAEKIDQPVIIGHDWGSIITARIVQIFPERVAAFGLLVASYQVPDPQFDYEKVLAFTKETMGYELIGYWGFFNEEDAARVIEDNIEKFINIIYPDDPKLWITDLTPTGACRNYLLKKPAAPSPSWLTAEEKRNYSEALLKGGLAAPTCYYKAMLRHGKEDSETVTPEKYKTDKPAFFGAVSDNGVAIASFSIQQTKAYCQNLTVKEFQANHWVQVQRADEVNQELEAWLRGLGL
ncbi:hypothetical protein V5O48_007480 [Marasmius crinis-equi]|uniref:AB hydrolase-1 domain-containing protein n=1 Tax=Marasmius crinis-equi TaxID=585013 RepID=A0ABR3FGJ9_9AGAR